jgi:hypothetical protein
MRSRQKQEETPEARLTYVSVQCLANGEVSHFPLPAISSQPWLDLR